MSGSLFAFRALSVGYEGRALIQDIELTVNQGEIVALIGPNGGGKSTILKTAARQLRRVAGAVELNGTDIAALSSGALAKQMAVALTERVNPELTSCFSFVAAGRYPHTGRLGALRDEDRRAVKEAMDAVRCGDLIGRDITRVSDGQRQRLVLARALAQEPRLMLLDEPTSFLDIRHKLELIVTLKRLARERGIAMLVSMHEVDLAQRLADRVLCVSGDILAPALEPEAAFEAERIERLYDLPTGAYDPMFGGVELPRVEGAPRVLVLSSGGGGVSAYRALQRKGIPFAAAILREGELDYHLAKRLAVATVEEAPYAPIGDQAFEQTRTLIERCESVVVAGVNASGVNRRLEALISIARALRKVEG